MSLEWLVNPFDISDLSGPSLPPDVPSDEQQRVALPASERSRWRQGALHAQPQISQRSTGWDGCGPFLSEGFRCITWNTRGLGPQQYHLSSGSAWKGRVSSSCPDIGSAISTLWCISS